jgi:hypothetical protein
MPCQNVWEVGYFPDSITSLLTHLCVNSEVLPRRNTPILKPRIDDVWVVSGFTTSIPHTWWAYTFVSYNVWDWRNWTTYGVRDLVDTHTNWIGTNFVSTLYQLDTKIMLLLTSCSAYLSFALADYAYQVDKFEFRVTNSEFWVEIIELQLETPIPQLSTNCSFVLSCYRHCHTSTFHHDHFDYRRLYGEAKTYEDPNHTSGCWLWEPNGLAAYDATKNYEHCNRTYSKQKADTKNGRARHKRVTMMLK